MPRRGCSIDSDRPRPHNDKGMAAKKTDSCRVLVVGAKQGAVSDARALLEDAGYRILEETGKKRSSSEPTVVLLLLDHDTPDIDALDRFVGGGEYPAPVVVVGPGRGKKWRRAALQAGAFACLSGNAPREDRIGIVAAANRYRALQLEIQIIRRESDIVMQGLLESFGSEAVRLKSVMSEAESVRASLEDVQTRIIRSML